MTFHADNSAVAAKLREAASLLQAQDASPYRVRAYRDAAQAIDLLSRDVRAIFETEGVKGLDAIPKVGLGIASAIAEILVRGRWSMLDRLRGESEPTALLQMVPGVGPRLAEAIHGELHTDSLERLEQAACDGRLAALAGVGERRAAAIRASLASMLGRNFEHVEHGKAEPDIGTLLAVDRDYRERAAQGRLRLIAPKRSVMHARRGPWHFTALHSGSALAHRLGRIHDWVVIYFYGADHVERSRTIVTEHRGPLAGRRVVRGREDECMQLLGGRNHASDTDHAAQPAQLHRAPGPHPAAA